MASPGFAFFMISFVATMQLARMGLVYLNVGLEFHPVALFSVGILFYISDHVSGTMEHKARIFALVNKAHLLSCAMFIWQFLEEGPKYQSVVRFIIMIISTISYLRVLLLQITLIINMKVMEALLIYYEVDPRLHNLIIHTTRLMY